MFRKKTILIVEDEEPLLVLLADNLSVQGDYTILKARNGLEAIAQMGQHTVDLILLDLVMPQMDGFAFLEHLEKTEQRNDIRVVVFSNLGKDEDKKKARAFGVIDYVVKANISISEAVAKVHKYLEE